MGLRMLSSFSHSFFSVCKHLPVTEGRQTALNRRENKQKSGYSACHVFKVQLSCPWHWTQLAWAGPGVATSLEHVMLKACEYTLYCQCRYRYCTAQMDVENVSAVTSVLLLVKSCGSHVDVLGTIDPGKLQGRLSISTESLAAALDMHCRPFDTLEFRIRTHLHTFANIRLC